MYQKKDIRRALEQYLECGSVSKTIRLLGYPNRRTMYNWINEYIQSWQNTEDPDDEYPIELRPNRQEILMEMRKARSDTGSAIDIGKEEESGLSLRIMQLDSRMNLLISEITELNENIRNITALMKQDTEVCRNRVREHDGSEAEIHFSLEPPKLMES